LQMMVMANAGHRAKGRPAPDSEAARLSK
jgi:hypothetical protein